MSRTFLFDLAKNFNIAGSRYILSTEETLYSDFDFVGEDTPENIKKLEEFGFVKKEVNASYLDVATVSLWTCPNTDLDVQVTLKKREHWENVLKMWNFFRKHPDLFKNRFWKSNKDNVIDRETVRERINDFLLYWAPHLNV